MANGGAYPETSSIPVPKSRLSFSSSPQLSAKLSTARPIDGFCDLSCNLPRSSALRTIRPTMVAVSFAYLTVNFVLYHSPVPQRMRCNGNLISHSSFSVSEHVRFIVFGVEKYSTFSKSTMEGRCSSGDLGN